MVKYAVPLQTGAYTTVYVEADSPEEAKEKVWDEGTPWVCAQCSGWGAHGNTGIEIGDWDHSNDSEPWVEEDD